MLQNFNRVESYIDSPDWKQIKATINPRNDDDKCFQYAAMVTLKHEKIGLLEFQELGLLLTNKTGMEYNAHQK